MRDAEALVEHLVRDREDGGVGSDGEGERAYGDGGEAGAFAEDAGGVAEVAPEVICPAEAEGGADAVLVRGDGAEFEAGLAFCLFGRETAASEIGFAGVDVELDFVVHVFFEAATAEGGAQP